MTLKKLTILSILISIGEPQQVQTQKLMTKEKFLNFGPSTVHSIKGKFYEEREIKKLPNPEITQNLYKLTNSDDNTDTKVIVNDQKKVVPKNNSEDESLKDPELNLNPIDDLLNTVHEKRDDEIPKVNIRPFNSTLGKEQPINFYNEQLVSDIQKNSTVETIKKELAFDSLLIKNNFGKGGYEVSPNMLNEYMDNEINPEADIAYSVKPLPKENDNKTRRLLPNIYYQSIPPQAIKRPIMGDDDMSSASPNDNDRLNKNLAPIEFINKKNEDKSPPCEDKESEEVESDEVMDKSAKETIFNEPTKGVGISKFIKNSIMLLDHPRVCYACSSVNDPSCWSPDRKTAVKYCRTDHTACLIKLYKYKGLSYTVRDCGNFCNRSEDGPKYTYCTICHHDLCNSAHLTTIHSVIIVIVLLINLGSTR